MLADQSLREVLAAFASPEPTPAGGSASALASALGVSLLLMAASLARSRTGSADERAALSVAARALSPLQRELIAGVDRDHEAYREIAAARRLSKTAHATNGPADDPVGRALQGATDVPIEVMRWSSLALQQASAVAAHCHRAAVSDVRVAIGLVRTGFSGAQSSAQDNLARMADGAYVQAARAEIDRLALDADRAADAAERLLLRPN
jgi:formiminotetrahydrofolate cyclodeaminase